MRSISAVSICLVRSHGTYSWMWMSRVTYEWVMSHVKESRWHKKHTSMSLVCDCFDASRMWLLCGERWHTWRSHVTYEWVMPHVKLSRYYATSPSISLVCICFVGNDGTYEGVVPYVNESCHKWRSHATIRRVRRVLSFVNAVWAVMAHMKESCHVWMSDIVSDGVTLPCDECIDLCRLWLLCGESRHIWKGHITYKAITMRSISDMLTYSASHAVFVEGVKYISVSRVHISNESWWSCCRYQISHLAHMNESRRT